MRVLITGGTGAVGQSITARLVDSGLDVRVIGIDAAADLGKAEYINCNIMDYANLREQMRGCAAVIHLAAISSPLHHPGKDVFRINTTGTFNVYEAADAEGIKRVVQASSINAMGCAWSMYDLDIQYFPLDEHHPRVTNDVYSFSKQVVEDIGDYYWRRSGISGVGMRLPAVYRADYVNSDTMQGKRKETLALVDELVGLSADVLAERIAPIREQVLDFRATGGMEFDPEREISGFDMPIPSEDLLWRAYNFDRFNFWAFIDERDSAQAFEKALLADYEGAHPLFVNSYQNWLDYDSQTLARLFYPEVTTWKHPLTGSETLVSNEAARQLIGYEPEHGVK